MFVLLEGEMMVSIPLGKGATKEVARLHPGDFVGEMALLANTKRSADIQSIGASSLAKLSLSGFDTLMDIHAPITLKLAKMASERLRANRLMTHLSRLLKSDDISLLTTFESKMEWIGLKKGEILFRQGDLGDSASVVVSGRLRVTRVNDHGEEHYIREIGSGEIVGSTSLLLETERAATVYAIRDSELARIPQHAFSELTQQFPDTGFELIRTILRREVSGTKVSLEDESPHTSIALVPLDRDIDMEAIQSLLTTELERFGPTTVLSPRRVGAHLNESGIVEMTDLETANLRIEQWVSSVESDYRFTIYQADSAEGNWSRIAIRRADLVVYVANANSEVHIREIETWNDADCTGAELGTSLLLLHAPDVRQPKNSRRWLEGRNIEVIYHVHEKSKSDMGRVARILSGNAVSVVLGGGGARAWAHIGAFRALEELGIPVDMVGGTSMGGAVAAFKAQGLSASEIFEEATRISRQIKDYTLPIVSIMSGKRLYKYINSAAGSWDIEDLWTRFFCVSTNMTTARAVCHRSGNLALAGRATLAIPGVFPPVVDGQNLLVDGSVLHNLPLEFMRDINPGGSIIALDVLPKTGPRARYDYGIHLSGWDVLRSRLFPWRKSIQMPSIAGTILRSMAIGSDLAREKSLENQLADLYINIDVRGVSMLEFEAVERAESIGYEKTIRRLEEWAQEEGIVDRLSP